MSFGQNNTMTALQSVEELLDLLFGAADLRRFVEKGFDGPNPEFISNGIQWDLPESHDLAAQVVEALELHGAVDHAFFDRLCATFPERAADIETVARQALPERTPAATTPRGPTPSASVEAQEDGVWDVFLAHAGPDGAAADSLCQLLLPQGLSVFLDSRRLRPGNRWDDVIPAALRGARMVVVLVSKRTRDAYYARQEIAMAIAASRQSAASTRVIPVYLDRQPEDPKDWLYGLQRLHGLVAAEAGWPAGVAERIAELCEDMSTEGSEPTLVAPADADDRSTQPEAPATYLHYLDMADGPRSKRAVAGAGEGMPFPAKRDFLAVRRAPPEPGSVRGTALALPGRGNRSASQDHPGAGAVGVRAASLRGGLGDKLAPGVRTRRGHGGGPPPGGGSPPTGVFGSR
jgi:hypothetical protein